MRVLELLASPIFLVPAALAAWVAIYIGRNAPTGVRVIAWLAVVPLALVGANIMVGVLSDPTSHNLWPFELALACVPSAVLFGLAGAVKKTMSR